MDLFLVALLNLVLGHCWRSFELYNLVLFLFYPNNFSLVNFVKSEVLCGFFLKKIN